MGAFPKADQKLKAGQHISHFPSPGAPDTEPDDCCGWPPCWSTRTLCSSPKSQCYSSIGTSWLNRASTMSAPDTIPLLDMGRWFEWSTLVSALRMLLCLSALFDIFVAQPCLRLGYRGRSVSRIVFSLFHHLQLHIDFVLASLILTRTLPCKYHPCPSPWRRTTTIRRKSSSSPHG